MYLFFFIHQLQGDYREFANVGQMNSPLQCAQYNGLIRKGMILAERKVCHTTLH